MTPAIIIGGMSFGWFTPTEAAAACVWALMLGVLLYRNITWKKFYKITMETIETTAAVLVIVGGASLFGWVLTTTQVTERVTSGLITISDNPLIINLILLVVGCFMETIAAIRALITVFPELTLVVPRYLYR